MLKIIIGLALVLLCGGALPGEQPAQTDHPPALARWEGSWSGAGKFFGQAAAQRMQWERVLDGQFVRLSMRVEAGGKTLFEGHGLASLSG